MRVLPLDPPRRFTTGRETKVHLADCGRVELAPDELVSLVTDSGREHQVVRKSWGFYATASLNGRLAREGLRGVLTKNEVGQYYLFLVEQDREPDFSRYLADHAMQIVCWMDADEPLQRLERSLAHET